MLLKTNALILILACSTLTFAQTNVNFVNPMIGTGGHGHTFPGPTRPMGMVQLSPDNKSNSSEWDWTSGYHISDTNIVGFSHTHLSGTGVSDLGDILLMPYIGDNPFPTEKNTEYTSGFSHKNEVAKVGYYSVFLNKPKVKAELTTTDKVGMHRYTFPNNTNSKIVIDLIHKIFWGNTDEATLDFNSDTTIIGRRIMGSGWQRHKRVYFYIKFSKPYKNVGSGEKIENMAEAMNTKYTKASNVKAFVTFDTKANEQIMVKVAISMVSEANAIKNMEEIPDWNFDKVVSDSKKVWENVLNKIKVEGTAKQKEIFYTAMYHSFIQPNQIADSDGSYMGPDFKDHISKTKKYYSTFSLWDTYRAAHPLYTLIAPTEATDMINSMMEHYENNSYLPIWTAWGSENHCMIANHSIPVITDAILKGLYTADLSKVLDAMVVSSTNDHPQSPWQRTNYEKLGFYPYELEHESISKTLESSFNDWCVAQVAKKVGNDGVYNRFMMRSNFYKNLFHPTAKLMYPKDKEGRWKPNFDPRQVGSGHVTEGNSWQYTWSVQHNPNQLVELFGGKKQFVKMLDSTFNDKNTHTSDVPDVTGLVGQYAHGNEPSHHTIFMYNYGGKPWETQSLAHLLLTTMYDNVPNGISGNEDCGQMSAWYIWNAMGMYPLNPASGNYDFGSPLMSKSVIDVGGGKTFTILAPKVSNKNIYIQAIKLNGKAYQKLYIAHTDMVKGGTLEFEMGSKPNLKLSSYEVPR